MIIIKKFGLNEILFANLS